MTVDGGGSEVTPKNRTLKVTNRRQGGQKLSEIVGHHYFTAESFGKVEPNLASTPPLECLQRKLLEESLI